VANPVLSRIRVIADKDRGLRVPTLCQQCQDAPCVSVCPVNALKRDNVLGITKLDKDRCIGCKMCMTVCPFGAISIDYKTKTMIKCDLCDGDPECVKHCLYGALSYVKPGEAIYAKRREGAQRLAEALKKLVG